MVHGSKTLTMDWQKVQSLLIAVDSLNNRHCRRAAVGESRLTGNAEHLHVRSCKQCGKMAIIFSMEGPSLFSYLVSWEGVSHWTTREQLPLDFMVANQLRWYIMSSIHLNPRYEKCPAPRAIEDMTYQYQRLSIRRMTLSNPPSLQADLQTLSWTMWREMK